MLIEKIETTWLEPTFQTIWINEPAENFGKAPESMTSNKVLISFFDGKLSTAYIEYNNIYQIVLYIIAYGSSKLDSRYNGRNWLDSGIQKAKYRKIKFNFNGNWWIYFPFVMGNKSILCFNILYIAITICGKWFTIYI